MRRCLSPTATTNAAHAITTINTLYSDRSARDRSGLFIAEGIRHFILAVDNGFGVNCILQSDKLLINPLARKLMRQARRSGVPTLNVSPEDFRRLSKAKRASGIAALVQQRWVALDQALPDQGLCWVVVHNVRSPGNLGTLIRTSSAVGAAGLILIGNSVDPYAPAVVRAAMGATFRQTFVRTNWRDLRPWIAKHRCSVIGATPSGSIDLHSFNPPEGAKLLLLGEERKGLTKQQQIMCDHFVRIPMQEGTDSLNLGVAGSLLLYEMYRNGRSLAYNA